jgi:hypothetical protein
VRRFAPFLAVLSSGVFAPVAAQAPPSADLWRVASSALALPAPLHTGATGMFWNPAAVAVPAGLAVAADAVVTSEVLGLSGLLAATSFALPGRLRAGVVAGRVEIRDLVRTTTSPNSTGDAIPVYEQFVGADLGMRVAWVQIGLGVSFHESRFDIASASGLTIDAGMRLNPIDRVTVAASTHLLPVDLSANTATEYLAAGEYMFVRRQPADGLHVRATARYGVAYQTRGAWEHVMGLGAELDGRVVLDLALASESGAVSRLWRPSLGLGLRFGGYTIHFAHGLSANDVGGTTRIGLDIRFAS